MRWALLVCALCGCGAEPNAPHDMDVQPHDLNVVDLSPPRDGPVATVNIPGCSMSPARRLSVSSRR